MNKIACLLFFTFLSIFISACGGGGDEGPCDVPSDLAKDGSLCGDRAASERPGGR